MKKPINYNAPRMGKKHFSTHVIDKALFQRFKKEYPEYKNMKWKEFIDYWLDITDTICEEAVFNPLGVKLGFYLGEVKTQYLPYNFKPVDRKLTSELGEEIHHRNILTRGKVAKVKWERRWAVRFNPVLQLYSFENNRKMNLLAKVHVTENPEKIRVSRNTLGGKKK